MLGSKEGVLTPGIQGTSFLSCTLHRRMDFCLHKKKREAVVELGLQSSRSSQKRLSGKGRSSSGTWHPWNALPSHPKSVSIPRSAAVFIQPGSGMGAAQCHHITPRASGKVERDKKSCCHLKSSISPLAPGGEGRGIAAGKVKQGSALFGGRREDQQLLEMAQG